MEFFQHVLASCEESKVVVDILMNHMAGPCKKAQQMTKRGKAEGTAFEDDNDSRGDHPNSLFFSRFSMGDLGVPHFRKPKK